MRLPFLPVVFDNFRPAPGVCVYFLSHFHTDHLIGLTPSWAAGTIYCSSITRGLLMDRFRLPAERVVALPFGVTRTIPLTRGDIPLQSSVAVGMGLRNCDDVSPSSSNESASAMSMRVTVFDAPHIPGSVMIHLDTCLGTYLYTGDFRLTLTNSKPLNPQGFLKSIDSGAGQDPESASPPPPQRKVKGKLPVDHLIVDDTWLHLTATHPGFLTEVEVLREFERITETINRLLAQVGPSDASAPPPCEIAPAVDPETDQTIDEGCDERTSSQNCDASLVEPLQQQETPAQAELVEPVEASSATAEAAESLNTATGTDQAFCLRVYLHNHFGKETILQQLAKRLQATIVVDERRYNYLSTIVRSELEQRSCSGGGDFQPSGIDLSLFTTASRHGRLATASTADVGQDGAGSCAFEVVTEPFPHRAIQVVPSRAWITPQSIRQARDQSGVPYFGLIMSGWAGVQKRAKLQAEETPDVIIWRLPYSLHCTPKELCAFVEAIRPLSVQSLHHSNSGDNERGLNLLKKCGRFLVSPGYNQPVSATFAMQKLPLSMMKMIYATNTTLPDTVGGTMRSELPCSRKRERASDERKGDFLQSEPVMGAEGRRGIRIRSPERSDDEVGEADWKAFDELLSVGVGFGAGVGGGVGGGDDLPTPSDYHLPASDLSVLSLLDRETSACREVEERSTNSASQGVPTSDLSLSLILTGLQASGSNFEPFGTLRSLLPLSATSTAGSQSEPRVLSAVANFERSLEEKRCSIVL